MLATKAFHPNCGLPLLQALVASSGYGVDLRGWLEGECLDIALGYVAGTLIESAGILRQP